MTTADPVPDLLEPVLDDLANILSHIAPDAESAPTPCTDYDLGTLRSHVVAWLATFAAGYSDPGGQAPPLEDFAPSAERSLAFAPGMLTDAYQGPGNDSRCRAPRPGRDPG